MSVWLAALLLILSSAGPIVDRCDRLELNSVYDRQGCLAFRQVIFWADGHVRDWRLADSVRIERIAEGWAATWHDGSEWRRVEADCYQRTWTQYDRELCERLRLPSDKRWKLTPAFNRR